MKEAGEEQGKRIRDPFWLTVEKNSVILRGMYVCHFGAGVPFWQA
jgi:hypothetical protein